MVEVHKNIGNFSAKAYSPKAEYLGEITTTSELADFRLQVCKEHIKGYSLLFNGKVIELNEFGNLSEWPKEFCFDEECASEIFKLQMKLRNN